MITRRHAIGAGAAVLGGAGLIVARSAALAAADDKLVLKASDVHPEGYPTVQAVEDMGAALAKATDGRLSIQMYASMQLGGEKEAIEQAQVGAVALVIAWITIVAHAWHVARANPINALRYE